MKRSHEMFNSGAMPARPFGFNRFPVAQRFPFGQAPQKANPTDFSPARPCSQPFPRADTGKRLARPPRVEGQILETLACLPPLFSSTGSSMPSLVAARHSIAGIPEDIQKILVDKLEAISTQNVVQRRQEIQRSIIDIVNNSFNGATLVEQRLVDLFNQEGDVEIDLTGMRVDRLAFVIRALRQAKATTSVFLNAAIRGPADRKYLNEIKKWIDRLKSDRTSVPRLSLQLSAGNWTGEDAEEDEDYPLIQKTIRILRCLVSERSEVDSLSIQVPLLLNQELVLYMLAVVHYVTGLRNLYIEIDHCDPGDAGNYYSDYTALTMQHLAMALQNHPTVEWFSFKSNQIPPMALFELSHELFLFSRFFGDEKSILQAGLGKTQTLETLTLKNPNWRDENWQALVAGLKTNRSVKTLHITDFREAGPTFLEPLLAVVAQHPRLEELQFTKTAFCSACEKLFKRFQVANHFTAAGVPKKILIDSPSREQN